MKKPTFDITALCIFTIVTIIVDKFIYDGWQWILEHQTCKINNIETICWGVSPFPTYALTLFAFFLTYITLYYDYEYIKWYLYERIK
jgi:hypothetical protein